MFNSHDMHPFAIKHYDEERLAANAEFVDNYSWRPIRIGSAVVSLLALFAILI